MAEKYGEFEYQVRLNVVIPLEWAKLLKLVASLHYDYKCKESGERGIINGLFNCANWTEKDGESASYMPVSWQDCDLMTKVMEQAHYHPEYHHTALKVDVWLRTMKEKIVVRHTQMTEAEASWKASVALQQAEARS